MIENGLKKTLAFEKPQLSGIQKSRRSTLDGLAQEK